MTQASQPIPQDSSSSPKRPDLRLIERRPHPRGYSFKKEVLLAEELPDLDPLDPLFDLYGDLWNREGPISHAVVRYRDRLGRVRQMAESWAPQWVVPATVLAESEMRDLSLLLTDRAEALQMGSFGGGWEEIFDVFREREITNYFFDQFVEPKRVEGNPYRFGTTLYFGSRLILAQYLVQPLDPRPVRWGWDR